MGRRVEAKEEETAEAEAEPPGERPRETLSASSAQALSRNSGGDGGGSEGGAVAGEGVPTVLVVDAPYRAVLPRRSSSMAHAPAGTSLCVAQAPWPSFVEGRLGRVSLLGSSPGQSRQCAGGWRDRVLDATTKETHPPLLGVAATASEGVGEKAMLRRRGRRMRPSLPSSEREMRKKRCSSRCPGGGGRCGGGGDDSAHAFGRAAVGPALLRAVTRPMPRATGKTPRAPNAGSHRGACSRRRRVDAGGAREGVIGQPVAFRPTCIYTTRNELRLARGPPPSCRRRCRRRCCSDGALTSPSLSSTSEEQDEDEPHLLRPRPGKARPGQADPRSTKHDPCRNAAIAPICPKKRVPCPHPPRLQPRCRQQRASRLLGMPPAPDHKAAAAAVLAGPLARCGVGVRGGLAALEARRVAAEACGDGAATRVAADSAAPSCAAHLARSARLLRRRTGGRPERPRASSAASASPQIGVRGQHAIRSTPRSRSRRARLAPAAGQRTGSRKREQPFSSPHDGQC